MTHTGIGRKILTVRNMNLIEKVSDTLLLQYTIKKSFSKIGTTDKTTGEYKVTDRVAVQYWVVFHKPFESAWITWDNVYNESVSRGCREEDLIVKHRYQARTAEGLELYLLILLHGRDKARKMLKLD
jgi:hypothetical protein